MSTCLLGDRRRGDVITHEDARAVVTGEVSAGQWGRVRHDDGTRRWLRLSTKVVFEGEREVVQ